MEYPEGLDAFDSSGSLISSAAYIDRGASIGLSWSEAFYGTAQGLMVCNLRSPGGTRKD